MVFGIGLSTEEYFRISDDPVKLNGAVSTLYHEIQCHLIHLIKGNGSSNLTTEQEHYNYYGLELIKKSDPKRYEYYNEIIKAGQSLRSDQLIEGSEAWKVQQEIDSYFKENETNKKK